MQIYAYKRAKLGPDVTDAEISRQIGMTQTAISKWKHVEGFAEWLEHQVTVYQTPIRERLEQVALDQVKDFRFWEAMGRKHGYITDKNEPVEQNLEPLVAALTKEQAKALLLKILTPEQEKQPESPQPKEPTNEGSSS